MIRGSIHAPTTGCRTARERSVGLPQFRHRMPIAFGARKWLESSVEPGRRAAGRATGAAPFTGLRFRRCCYAKSADFASGLRVNFRQMNHVLSETSYFRPYEVLHMRTASQELTVVRLSNRPALAAAEWSVCLEEVTESEKLESICPCHRSNWVAGADSIACHQ